MERNTEAKKRALNQVAIQSDLVVVGGGMAGTCCAITAARQGVKVTLVQDRPVLGGNASSEIRLWALGATSHMGNNNRWAREGGLVDEILVENVYRNKEGNPLIFDTVLLEKVVQEPNIRLLLNTAVYDVEMSAPDTVSRVWAFCSQNSTRYILEAPLFCDASGDGIVAFQAGAPFRMGAEEQDEFGEGFEPGGDYGELLGDTIYFFSKDTGEPVKYVAPEYALKDITQLPRFRDIDVNIGSTLWWLEYGGSRDIVHDTEEIKWELWKIVYGVWDYIKNSGKFPQAETMTLEWVGTIPGKRESRRFEGDYMLRQQDVVEQREHSDAVAVGGWAIDLHPVDAVYSDRPACTQWHSKGVYGIPYRCYYSRNISNLFLAGRIISVSHVAFGSTRVMLTCAHGGTAVGMAAAHCLADNLIPRDLTAPERMEALQTALNREGQSIPGIAIRDDGSLTRSVNVSDSSTLELARIPSGNTWIDLEHPIAQLLPFEPHYRPCITATVRSLGRSQLRVALRTSEKPFNYTPEMAIEEIEFDLKPGEQEIEIRFTRNVDEVEYAFVCFYADKSVEIETSPFMCSGITSVQKKFHKAVSNNGTQVPPPGIGIDQFEFWVPARRPKGRNLALRLEPALPAFGSDHIGNGYTKPWIRTNAWVADPTDPEPKLTFSWDQPQTISSIYLYFDTDYDHAMETSHWGHPEDVMPFCVRNYRIVDDKGRTVYECSENYQTINRIHLGQPLVTQKLEIVLEHPSENVPAALFEVRIY